MSAIHTKFSVGDTCYTFESWTGQIKKHEIQGIFITMNTGVEVMYQLIPPPANQNTLEEQELYTDVEVKELANCWLIEKSVSIFSRAGL